MIQEEAFRCKSITEKLLDFSRCAEIQRERTDLAGLIQGVVEMIRHMGKYRGKRSSSSPARPSWRTSTARRSSRSCSTWWSTRSTRWTPTARSGSTSATADGMAEMVFADDGCGMTPEVLENIFEPFFTRRRVGKGTGLGLSITHRIISQHQGEITATSPGEDQGATFVVRLPVRSREDDDRRRPGRPPAPKGQWAA